MGRYQTDSLFETKDCQRAGAGHIIRVAFESAVDNEFDYIVPDELWPVKAGQRVEVPFGRRNKLEKGFCVEADISPENSFAVRGRVRVLKEVAGVIDKEPLIDAGLMELAKWISGYYVCPLGQVLAAIVPSAVKKGVGARKRKFVYLAKDYGQVIGQLRSKKQKQIVAMLNERGAFSHDFALELDDVLGQIGSTNAPVKKLAEKQILKIVQKEVLKALPAIPEGLSIKAGNIALNSDQQNALDYIKAGVVSGGFGVTLLHGVTDSGKTEVYIRAIEKTIDSGRGAIVLLPEIALTTQTVQRFSDRFERIAVMHSGLSAAQRNIQWQKIKAGQADVVIGARSAVFAPLANPGLIIVDEEHEPSYKQDTAPRYNGRDVAVKRAQISNAHCVLGTATPSLETLFNCKNKKHFGLVNLPKRVMDLPMPEMRLVDLRRQCMDKNGIDLISKPLAESLKEILVRKEQAILLLNRRGYSRFVFCPSCKHILSCRNCDVTMTFHKSGDKGRQMETVTGKHVAGGFATCHYCGAQKLVPENCPLCGKAMKMIGSGSQRLEEELAGRFPQARVARIDSDSMASRDYYSLLKDFSDGRIDILAGTQMLAKGLHFPNVTLVGIISADTSLYLPDFRANERTFQLISQVAGRTGRSEKKGIVFVQTFLADQPAIKFAMSGDFDGFVSEELKHRKACNLPPYSRLAVVVLSDMNFDKLTAASRAMRDRIDGIVQNDGLEAAVKGPIPAGVSRIQRFHRMQIIIQAGQAASMVRLFSLLRAAGPVKPAVKVVIDMDPVNLL